MCKHMRYVGIFYAVMAATIWGIFAFFSSVVRKQEVKILGKKQEGTIVAGLNNHETVESFFQAIIC